MMNLKMYRKLKQRGYANIYQHRKNKNYIIRVNSREVETTISKNHLGQKIFDKREALAIAHNTSFVAQKVKEAQDKSNFDDTLDKYLENCEYSEKMAYNTLKRKKKCYDKYLRGKVDIKVTKATKSFWAKFIDKQECSLKQKNYLLKELKAFYNWCIKEEIVEHNPLDSIKKYKVEETEIVFWNQEELKQFLSTLDLYIEQNIDDKRYYAHMIKALTKVCFLLGDRIGETRALTFDCVNEDDDFIKIKHSIEYDPDKDDFKGNTKNYNSKRTVAITDNFKNTLKEYKEFLEEYYGIKIKDSDNLFFNYERNACYSDSFLREHFKEFCNIAGVKIIHLKNLRHTSITALSSKPIKAVGKRAGHKKEQTTMNYYLGVTNEEDKELAQLLDDFINK